MSNKTINDYTAANSIDGSNDYLLIEQSSVYKKINRTTYLGISGSPVGTSDSQALTNKTIGNTNTFTAKDTLFTLQDDGDTTKQAQFQLSGITTATTRTYTLPDANTTLVGTGTTQTLTSKTLTSPTITGGTIDNSTVTVDSISGHTSATTVTVANLQIVNGVLNSANAVTATAIAAGAIQPQALVSGTGSGWAWQSWSPSYTNLTTGNGTTDYARYIQTGKTVTLRLRFTLGSTSSISGVIGFSLPVTANSSLSGASDVPLYNGQLNDASGNRWQPYVTFGSTSRMDVYYLNSSVNLANTSSSAPFVWTTSDQIIISAQYEAA